MNCSVEIAPDFKGSQAAGLPGCRVLPGAAGFMPGCRGAAGLVPGQAAGLPGPGLNVQCALCALTLS